MGRKEITYITIVSGLPRSGTSMMMKMLVAGGIAPLTDAIRSADGDNPEGYYEFERVKQLDKGDTTWLVEAQGKVVKVISALLKHLPTRYEYRVVFMRRRIEEVLASQKKMLIHRGEATDAVSDEELAQLYRKHLGQVDAWLNSQPNVRVLYVNYNTILKNPEAELPAILAFFDDKLDRDKMLQVVKPELYRNRT
ncbi:MAG: sulfotransferase family protein [Chloroflexi bacterium]|nr:sulfotransferase family protein [Chloroflexota bacterium]MBP8055859.1 sulfotransferase family protein [Chloroflexota bacterium]